MTFMTARFRHRAMTPANDVALPSIDELLELSEQLNGRPLPGVRMSESAFAQWCPSDLRAEWVNGEVIVMAPVSDGHSDLTLWFARLVGDFIEAENIGVIRHDMFVRLPGQRRRRLADLLFISSARTSIIKETVIDGAPDLAVEIVSRDSQSRDRREKYFEYEQAGVREYWILDPLSKTLDAYALHRKRYVELDVIDDWVSSKVLPGFHVKPSMLWQRPLPKVATTLKRMRNRG